MEKERIYIRSIYLFCKQETDISFVCANIIFKLFYSISKLIKATSRILKELDIRTNC